MRKWLVRLAILAAAALLVALLWPALFSADPVPVDVVEVARGPVEETVTNSRAGTVMARRRARMAPEIGGQVVALPFREGDRVKAGDEVLRLDASTQRAQLELSLKELDSARAEKERACLAAERAARELDRIGRLAAESIVSTDLLDQVESARRTADAACRAAAAGAARAEAAVALYRTELAKTTLRSPFDGIVAEVAAEVGEWVTPSPPALPVPPVLDLLDPESVYISAPMDEVDSARIRVGLDARVTVDSHRDRTLVGRVSRVAPYVLDLEQQNRTVEIEVDLEASDIAATLLPGTSADVEVILDRRDDVLRIPTAALMEGSRVLVLEGERLDERQVETGLRNWDFTEIRSGLESGARVVVSLDRPEIKDGARAEAESRPAA